MKTTQITALLLALTALSSRAADGEVTLSEQEIRAIGPLPEDKVAETLKKGDRNPFAERHITQTLKEDGESEDSKLRTMLNNIIPSGVIKDRDGRLKVLFNRQLLAEGDKVQTLVENQVALLRVTKITPSAVEISWVEDQVNAQSRKVIRPVQINQGIIEQQRQTPAVDGKAGTIREFITTSGETYKEPTGSPPPDADPSAPANPAETMTNEIEAAPSLMRTFRSKGDKRGALKP